MSLLSIDDNLFGLIRCCLKLLFDALLDIEHYRAGGVDNLYAIATGYFICLWRLAMRTEQYTPKLSPLTDRVRETLDRETLPTG